jgi:glycerophosphoryl diester phosphodiesterase
MAIPTRGTWSGGQNSGTSVASIDVSAVANGSYILMVYMAATAATNVTIASGGGTAWTQLLGGKVTVGSRNIYVAAKIKESGDTAVTLTKSATDYMSWSYLIGTGAAAVADWIVGTGKLRATAPAETVTTTGLSITTPTADYLAIGISGEATSAVEGSAPVTSGTGWTNGQFTAHTAAAGVNIEQIRLNYKEMASAGATGNVTDTYSNTQASNGYGIQIGIKPAAASNVPPVAAFTTSTDGLDVNVDGTTSTDSDGTITSYSWDWGDGTTDGSGSTASHTYAVAGTFTITLTVTDNNSASDTQTHDVSVAPNPVLFVGTGAVDDIRVGTEHASALYLGTALVHRFGYTVNQMMDESEIRVAWRALGDEQPEMSMVGYHAAVNAGWKILEVSVRLSSDGVWIMNHDTTLTRTTTSSATIASSTAASMLGTTIDYPFSAGGSVVGRLEDLLDAYGSTHVFFIDNKSNEFGFGSTTTLLDLLDAYPNSTEHFVFKGFKGWAPAADLARARGYLTWGIYYDGEVSTSPNYASWDLLGLNTDAIQANWDVINAQGKRVLGHVVHNLTDRTTGLSKGATGFMTGITLP